MGAGRPGHGHQAGTRSSAELAGRRPQALRPRHRLRHLRLLHRARQRQGQGQPRRLHRQRGRQRPGHRASPATATPWATSASPTTWRTRASSRPCTVDGGNGPASRPRPQTVENGTYPLSRPLFIYVRSSEIEKPEVKAFVDFYVKNAAKLAAEVGYVKFPDRRLHAGRRSAGQP